MMSRHNQHRQSWHDRKETEECQKERVVSTVVASRDSPGSKRRQNTRLEHTYSLVMGKGAAGTAWRPAHEAWATWQSKWPKLKPAIRTHEVLQQFKNKGTVGLIEH